jgi:hypothetical protein
MNASQGAVWFIGDLSDPWVSAIADALPVSVSVVRVDCAVELPERPLGGAPAPHLVVVHRNRLSAADAEQLRAFRMLCEPESPPALILCVSPFVGYEDLESWSGVADVVLSEATAAELLPRHVARILGERQTRASRSDRLAFRIEVASGNHELSVALAEACIGAGYRASQVGDVVMREIARRAARLASSGERVLTIWDAPVLEPLWCERLKQYSAMTGPVIALIGFADRTSVALAKTSGAMACLELPYDVEDLLHVIDRTARSLLSGSWPMPARVEPPHRLPPRPRRRDRRRDAPTPEPMSQWPDHDRLPTIP